MGFGPQTNGQDPACNRTLDNGLGQNAADRRLGARGGRRLFGGSRTQGCLEVYSFGNPLAVSEYVCLKGHGGKIIAWLAAAKGSCKG